VAAAAAPAALKSTEANGTAAQLARYRATGGFPAMTISLVHLQPLVALIAGILILLIPRLLNFIVAIYLIIIGVTGLWPNLLH
jgi:hypothetical protein